MLLFLWKGKERQEDTAWLLHPESRKSHLKKLKHIHTSLGSVSLEATQQGYKDTRKPILGSIHVVGQNKQAVINDGKLKDKPQYGNAILSNITIRFPVGSGNSELVSGGDRRRDEGYQAEGQS